MDLSKLNEKIRAGIVGVFLVISIFVLIRMLLILVGANELSEFISFWYSFTNIFVEPFSGVYPNWIIGSLTFESASILCIFTLLLFSLLIAKIITTFVSNDPKKVLINLIDTFFKIVEFVFLFRFLLRLTGASSKGDFTTSIYSISSVFYEPFQNILPTLTFGSLDQFIFETSTLIALIILIILDLTSESFFYGILNSNSNKKLPEKYNPFDSNNQNPFINQAPFVSIPSQSPQVFHPPVQNTPTTNINIHIPSSGQSPQSNGFPVQESKQFINVNPYQQSQNYSDDGLHNHSNQNNNVYPEQWPNLTDNNQSQFQSNQPR